jgi:hypothetical protein
MSLLNFYSQSVLKRNTANMYLVKENHKTYVNAVSRHYFPMNKVSGKWHFRARHTNRLHNSIRRLSVHIKCKALSDIDIRTTWSNKTDEDYKEVQNTNKL